MSSVSSNPPRLQLKRGPQTLRGKFHASRNATKYEFTSVRTKGDRDLQLYKAIKHVLRNDLDMSGAGHDLDAIATAILNFYRIRSEAEATTLKLTRSQPVSSEAGFERYLVHLEGLRRYERRARSRLMTLTRTGSDNKSSKLSYLIRRSAHQDRSSS